MLNLSDSYVKVLLVGCKQIINSKKTHTVYASLEPQFDEMLKFTGSDVMGRQIRVVIALKVTKIII